jgi:predicted transcriptional regulator
MEVNFAPEKQARIREVAERAGVAVSQVVEEAVDHWLAYETQFIEAVEIGRAAARRGDLLEHDMVVARVEHLFHR